MVANVDEQKYGALLAATLPGVVSDDVELEHLTEEVNRLATKGIKENRLSPEEEKLPALLTRLIEKIGHRFFCKNVAKSFAIN